MRKKLTRLGNSSALILDKPLMAILGLKPNDTVTLVTDGMNLIITPTFRRATRKESEAAYKKTLARHGEALRALGDASPAGMRRPSVEELGDAIGYALEKYGNALDRLGDASAPAKPKKRG